MDCAQLQANKAGHPGRHQCGQFATKVAGWKYLNERIGLHRLENVKNLEQLYLLKISPRSIKMYSHVF